MNFTRSIWRRVLLALTFAATINAMVAAEVRPFTAQSFREIRAAHEGRPLVIAFWSVACEPCREEMTVLTKLHRTFPAIPIVLVAADGPEHRAAVLRFVERYELGKIEVRQFDDEPDERLRYSVDHTWRGELPRSYFFDAKGVMTTQSGVPEEKWAEDWFKQQSATSKAPAH